MHQRLFSVTAGSLVGLALLGGAACSTQSQSTDPCELGTERCGCFGNDTCFAPLRCASGLCVVDPFAQGGAAGAGASSAGPNDSPAPLGAPCEPCPSAELCRRSASLACGGYDCIGIGTSTYCSRDCESDADCADAEMAMSCLQACSGGSGDALAFVGACLARDDFELFGGVFCGE